MVKQLKKYQEINSVNISNINCRLFNASKKKTVQNYQFQFQFQFQFNGLLKITQKPSFNYQSSQLHSGSLVFCSL